MSSLQSSIPGSSGAVLRCRHTKVDRSRPSALLALPFGVPAGVASAAFEKLGRSFNVVTWESRFILSLEQPFSGDEKLSPDEHVEDMRCILRELEIGACVLIGYCSGAGISLLAASRYPEIFTRLILVNGEYQLFRRGHASTDYQRSIDTFLPVVATGRRQASFIFSKMAEISKASRAGAGEPTELDRQINVPFSNEESLFRYAKNYMAYREYDALAVARGVRQRTLVLTGRKDVHSTADNSRAIAEAIPGAAQIVDDQGDHYELCRAGSATLEAIGQALGSP